MQKKQKEQNKQKKKICRSVQKAVIEEKAEGGWVAEKT